MPARREAAPVIDDEAGLDARELTSRLGAWFDVARRDLPWRRTRDPYAIWLSEVMLQQTRVATVVEYFGRFLERFPTVEALAAAEADEVLGAWSGLGYYRRARALHLGAREVVARYGGALPRDAAALRAIPGIGAYTAGAIASIAFGRREPLVDGNVARVLARVFGIDDDVRAPATAKRLWALAERLVPSDSPGRHNEALMELGATVCTPREPKCLVCPLRDLCVARREGRQDELPVVAKKRRPKVVRMAALVATRGAEVLLAKRSDDGAFAGMWEPPMVETDGAEPAAALAALVGCKLAGAREVGSERHVLTHRELRVAVVAATVRARRLPAASGAYARFDWLRPDALDDRGVSTLARKVLAHARLG